MSATTDSDQKSVRDDGRRTDTLAVTFCDYRPWPLGFHVVLARHPGRELATLDEFVVVGTLNLSALRSSGQYTRSDFAAPDRTETVRQYNTRVCPSMRILSVRPIA